MAGLGPAIRVFASLKGESLMPAPSGMTVAINASLVIAGLDPAIQGRFLGVCC